MEDPKEALIPLSNGGFAIIDYEDIDIVAEHEPWYKHKLSPNSHCQYALSYQGRDRKKLLMHRLILNLEDDEICDHANRNGLDNRKANLRRCTQSQNQGNRVMSYAKKTSQYKGVCWLKRRNVWQAQIGHNGRHLYLGSYHSEEEAALAYNKAAIELFGEFARTNLINR